MLLARAAVGLVPVLLLAAGAASIFAVSMRRRGISVHRRLQTELIRPGFLLSVTATALASTIGWDLVLFTHGPVRRGFGVLIGVGGFVGVTMRMFVLLYAVGDSKPEPRAM